MPPRDWFPFSRSVDAVMVPEVVTNSLAVVIHIWAEWNPADSMMDQRLRALQAADYHRIEFRSMDSADESNWGFITELHLVNLPALAIYAGGKLVDLHVGLLPEEKLKRTLRGILVSTGLAIAKQTRPTMRLKR